MRAETMSWPISGGVRWGSKQQFGSRKEAFWHVRLFRDLNQESIRSSREISPIWKSVRCFVVDLVDTQVWDQNCLFE